MRRYNHGFRVALIAFVFGISLLSCSSIPELKVHYQLPPASDQLRGKGLVFVFEDERESKEIFGRGALSEYRGFSGYISFSLSRYGEEGFKIGVFEVPGLFKEGFKRKLQNLDMDVQFDSGSGEPELVIALKEFFLDLVEDRWKARISYDARVMKDGRLRATQTISGEAERLRIYGRSGADALMGELFTDTLNRLNMERLLMEADLTSS
jgi:hypothetical protein